MLRIACDCRMADWSGVGRYSTGLVRALAASGEIDLVQVVRPGGPAPAAEAPTVEAGGSPFGIAGARALSSAVRSIRPDVTHCLHFPTPLPAHHPLVVTLHDVTPLVMPEVMPSALRRSVYGWWNRRAARVADRIVAPSSHTASDVSRFFPAAAGKLRVVPEAADDFSGGPAGELPEVARGKTYLLTMGNTKANKDLPTLLRAFAELAPRHPGLELLLVGAEAPGLVLPEGARFTGRVTDEGLRALYAGASAFVFPSRYEGFGLPVLEAMALGAPVVIADASSLPEVAGAAAAAFPAGDAPALADVLERLLSDAEVRARLVADGRDRAASFSWAETARLTLEVYRELVA